MTMNRGMTGATAPGLLAMRSAAQAILDQAGLLTNGWRVRGIRRLDGRSVVLDVGPHEGSGVALEWIEPGDDAVEAFLHGADYAVAYRTGPEAWDLDDEATPGDVKKFAASACRALSGAPRTISLRLADDADAVNREVTFDPDDFGSWLSQRISVGDELVDGWSLSDIYPVGGEGLAVCFERQGSSFAPRLKVRPRDDERPAAFRTRSLDVSYTLVFGSSTNSTRADANSALSTELGLLLESIEHGVHFVPPDDIDVQPGRVLDAPPPAMNLAIPAPCGFKCTFCSVREEVYVVTDSDSPFVETLRDDIVRAGMAGTRILRINGIEPLAAPYLVHLLDTARESGFEEFHLFSTCRPLGDRAFAEHFLAAMPARYRIHVPVYGSNAETHDGITGTPGSFDDMLQAVSVVRELMDDRGMIIFTTVLTRANMDDAAAIRDLVKPLGRWWEVHLAFPNTSSRTDPYRNVAIPMTQAIERIYPKGWWPLAELELGEVLPCIALRHQEQTDHALLTPDRIRGRMLDPAGTYYASARFEHSLGEDRAAAFTASTVPCPHTSTCALAAACPAKVYSLYAELFGLDELQPVDRERIGALAEGQAILTALDSI